MKQQKYNVMLEGDPGVGKSQILNQLKNKQFSLEYSPTFGIDIVSMENYKNQTSLEIHDLTGDQHQLELLRNLFVDKDGCIVVYDISNNDALERVSFWVNYFLNKQNYIKQRSGQIPIFIIGNKADLLINKAELSRKNQIKRDSFQNIQIQTLSEEKQPFLNAIRKNVREDIQDLIQLHYFSCSAKNQESVKGIFDQICSHLYKCRVSESYSTLPSSNQRQQEEHREDQQDEKKNCSCPGCCIF